MPKASLDREHVATIRGLLEAERKTLASLGGVVPKAMARSLDRLASARTNAQASAVARTMADNIETAMRDAIRESRISARIISAGKVKMQFGSIGKLLGVKIDLEQLKPPKADEVQARATAKSYRGAWQSDVLARLSRWTREADGSADKAAHEATKAQAYRVDRIATTETAIAYNDESSRVVSAAADSGELWTQVTFRRWDARLDARVCSVCADYDGDEVPLDASFRDGAEPGAVHPRCRCVSTIVTFPDRLAILEAQEAKRREWTNPKTGKPFQGR